jgi:hypothetical protein
MTYTADFAESIWLPFKPGTIRACIANASSIKSDFLNDSACWASITGHVYTEKEMDSLWSMIEEQKKRVQAFFLVHIGKFTAFNPAYASL